MEKTITCHICGKKEDVSSYIKDWASDLVEHKVCTQCNHWRLNKYWDDNDRGPHGWAVINGAHYTIDPKTIVKGFYGAKHTIKFQDGTIVHTDNVWHQGNILDAHPYWREIFPDNAEFITND